MTSRTPTTAGLQVLLLLTVLLPSCIFVSCATDPRVAGSIVETAGPQTEAADIPSGLDGTTFYLAKGNVSSNINNLMFAWYAGHLKTVFSRYGMVPSSYGSADIVIMVEYGRKTYPETSLVFARRYDPASNTTRWVHEETEPVRMTHLTLTALDGDAYRDDWSKERRWQMEIRREYGGRPFRDIFPDLLRSLWIYFEER